MSKAAQLLVVLALAGGGYVGADSVDSSTAAQCAALETCYEGGVSSMPCTITTGECPSCVLFTDKSCYIQLDGSCPFGSDCSDIFSSKSGASNSSSSNSNSDTVGTSTTSSSASLSQPVESSPSNDGSSSNSSTADSDGSNTVLIIAILAVAVGVAVLAVVSRKLFLRARAESERDEAVPSPPATIRTASFSSNGTSLDPGIVISRSAMGTDLSVASKTSAVDEHRVH